MNKICTTIKQSKKLLELGIDINTADMHSEAVDDEGNMVFIVVNGLGDKTKSNYGSPVWSLAALINIIPQELFDGEYIINITEGINRKWIISYEYHIEGSSYINVSSDSLIDCCVEMIIKLKERKLL